MVPAVLLVALLLQAGAQEAPVQGLMEKAKTENDRYTALVGSSSTPKN